MSNKGSTDEQGTGFFPMEVGIRRMRSLALLCLVSSMLLLSAIGSSGSLRAGQSMLSEGSVAHAVSANLLYEEVVIADAGPDSIVYWNEQYATNGSWVLDGRGTDGPTDAKRYLYVWTFYDEGPVELRGRQVTYTWAHVGVFIVTLNATDPTNGMYDTVQKTVTVIPKADLGTSDRIMLEGTNTTVYFNGSDSGSDYGIVSYTWTFNYSGDLLTYTDASWSFNFTKPGTYRVQLKVEDGLGNIGHNNATIKVTKEPTFFSEHWLGLIVWPAVLIIFALWAVSKYKRDRALVTPTDVEKVKLQWKGVKRDWKIFRSNRLGFAGLIILFIFVGMAFFAPWISTVSDPSNTDHLEPSVYFQDDTPDWVNPLPPSWMRSNYTGYRHPFGTDGQGQDVYSMTMYGAKASLIVGLAATLISVVLGTLIGLGAGYFGKISDEVLMRVTDFFLVLPWFPLMIVMMAILGREFVWVVVVIGITSWPSTARVVRAQVLTIKERQFIVRAKAVAAGDAHILKTHILPNVLPLIFANTVLLIAIAIFSEAFLDFFGLGDPSVISWGSMLESAYNADAFLTGAWWWIAAPGAAIVLMVLAFSLVGYAVDDVLNPKLRKR